MTCKFCGKALDHNDRNRMYTDNVCRECALKNNICEDCGTPVVVTSSFACTGWHTILVPWPEPRIKLSRHKPIRVIYETIQKLGDRMGVEY